MVSLAYDLPTNLQFQYLMYRPLYWFGKNGEPSMDSSISLAQAPQYTNGDKTVTITLKDYSWSDGKPVTSRDLEFWINLLRAEKANWALYLPGGFPDNVAKVSAPDPRHLRLDLTHAFNPEWFTQTQLSQIFPIPQHVWDKTSTSGKVGNYDRTTAGAKAVYKFLDSQSRHTSDYTTNPLWQVVDGPWKLSSYRSDGYAAFVPNPKYSGAKPSISKFVMEPFTSDAAEFNVLQSGCLTYGYIPLTDLSQKSRLQSLGYSIAPWPSWSISYIVLNFNNPTVGPILRQLYIRQALEKLIDQQGYIKAFLKGNGITTNGPAPLQPASQFVSPQMKKGYYTYDPSGAVALLRAHGWDVKPNGTTTCAHPGTGSGECGKGIASGAPLSFQMKYLSGVTYLTQEMQTWKSALLKAGIQLSLTQGSEGQVVDTATACKPGPGCGWQMVQWGSPSWIWSNPYPSGEATFATGAGVNAGSYSDPRNDANIKAVETSSNPSAFTTYENYLAQQLPVLWLPNTYNQVSAVKSNLRGALPQSPLLFVNPESWTFTK
ncbi:MAG TPA: peptide ABC transporter substrate-binding protein [Mycobacteriales bacterium]|nr:peptide ABC transporter substrate-binding protein [Mycobacteriales bacterium]